MQTANPVKHVSHTLALESVLNKHTPVSLTSTKKQAASNKERALGPENLIATLWLQLSDIYGARFVNQYGEKDSGVWYQALHDLSEEDIRFGLYTMMRDSRFETWPPNCTQFRHLCKRPELKVLPSVHQAFREARENLLFDKPRHWSHPAVKFTVKYAGIELVNSADTQSAFKAFSRAYEKVCECMACGQSVPLVADEDVVIKQKKSNLSIPRLSQYIRQLP